jgi:hypothetical protein
LAEIDIDKELWQKSTLLKGFGKRPNHSRV